MLAAHGQPGHSGSTALKLKSINDANVQGYAENQEAIKAHLYCLLGSAPMEALQRDENDSYKQVMDKLTQIYLPKEDTNTRIGAFRQIKQLDGEIFDHFIVRLQNASIGYGFTNVKNEMVIQITHHAKSRQLKDAIALSSETDFDKIVKMARTVERLDNERTQEEQVNAISHIAPRSNHNHHYQPTTNHARTAPRPSTHHPQTSYYQQSMPYNRQEQRSPWFSKGNNIETCTRCGQEVPHRFGQCPAINQHCNVSRRTGHFGKVCRSKIEINFRRNRSEEYITSLKRADITPESKQQIQWMQQHSNDGSQEPKRQEREDEYEHIFAIGIKEQDNRKYADVTILGESFKFLIDTGTTMNIMDEISYERIRNKQEPLSNTNVSIKAYNSEKPSKSIGKFEANIEVNNTQTKTTFTVVRGQSGCILGLNTLESINMITFDSCVFTIEEGDHDPQSQIDKKMKTRKLNFDKTAEEKQTTETRENTPTAEKEHNEKQIEEPEKRSYTHRAKEADNSGRLNNGNIKTEVETNKAKRDIESARVNQEWIVEKKAKSCTKEPSSKATNRSNKKTRKAPYSLNRDMKEAVEKISKKHKTKNQTSKPSKIIYKKRQIKAHIEPHKRVREKQIRGRTKINTMIMDTAIKKKKLRSVNRSKIKPK